MCRLLFSPRILSNLALMRAKSRATSLSKWTRGLLEGGAAGRSSPSPAGAGEIGSKLARSGSTKCRSNEAMRKWN